MTTILDLLQKVVLLLTHYHLTSIFFTLLELILQGLRIDAHAPIRHDLLSSIRCDPNAGDPDPDTAMDTRVKGKQVVLQVDDLHVWLGQRPADHILFDHIHLGATPLSICTSAPVGVAAERTVNVDLVFLNTFLEVVLRIILPMRRPDLLDISHC